MVIQSVVYTDQVCKVLGSSYLKELGGLPYKKFQPIKPNTLLLGTNCEHNIAHYLSNLPLVIIDRHTDMYLDYSKNKLGMHSGNWVFWTLEQGREVHLVLPDVTSSSPNNSVLSKKSEKNIHIYSPKPGSLYKFKNNCSKIVKDISELHEKMNGQNKQISIDFDFMSISSMEYALKIFSPLTKGENVYDFWLNTSYPHEDWMACISRRKELRILKSLIDATGWKI